MQSSHKPKNFLISGLILILLAAVLLFLYPGFLRGKRDHALSNRRYSIWDQQDTADRLRGRRTKLENLFYKNFLIPFEKDGKATDMQGITHQITITLNASDELNKQDEFWLEDQLLYGKYLALTGQKREFINWQKQIEQLYLYENSWVLVLNKNMEVLDKTENTWPYDLKYAEVLLTAYNLDPSRALKKDLEAVMERAEPYFSVAELTPNTQMEVENVYYPETSSDNKPTVNPDLLDPYNEEQFIRLSDVNLFVLESFAELDESWLKPCQTWKKVFADSLAENSTFYPLGVFPDLKSFIMSGEQAFTVCTKDNIRILYQNPFAVETPTTSGFFKKTILARNSLAKSYHIATEQSLSDESDLAALSIFSQYLTARSPENSAETEQLLDSIRIGFRLQRFDDELSPLDQMYHQTIHGQEVLFTAEDQLQVLISGLEE